MPEILVIAFFVIIVGTIIGIIISGINLLKFTILRSNPRSKELSKFVSEDSSTEVDGAVWKHKKTYKYQETNDKSLNQEIKKYVDAKLKYDDAMSNLVWPMVILFSIGIIFFIVSD